MDGEEERRVAKEVALENRGDDRPAVQVLFGDVARCAIGGDDLLERGFVDRADFLLGCLHNMATDLGQDLLPLHGA
ncbi:MAG: hypothetical protein MUC72_11955 [Acidobacteria bacterium]|nr:hypothetical protein [Acidobacteriota bacterium]